MHFYVCSNIGVTYYELFEDLINYLKTAKPQPDDPIWIDFIGSPTEDEMNIIQFMFNLHPVTASEIMCDDGTAKWELFDNYIFIICSIKNDEDDDSSLIYITMDNTCVLTFHREENAGVSLVRSYFLQPIEQV